MAVLKRVYLKIHDFDEFNFFLFYFVKDARDRQQRCFFFCLSVIAPTRLASCLPEQTDPYTNACNIAQPTITTIIINGKEKRDSINSHALCRTLQVCSVRCIGCCCRADGLLKVMYYASTFVINLCSQ